MSGARIGDAATDAAARDGASLEGTYARRGKRGFVFAIGPRPIRREVEASVNNSDPIEANPIQSLDQLQVGESRADLVLQRAHIRIGEALQQ